MPIRGSPNGAVRPIHTLHSPDEGVDVIARNGWTSSMGIGGRHHSVRPIAPPIDGTVVPLPSVDRRQIGICAIALATLLVLFATPLPREISALLIAACLIVSHTVPSRQLLDEVDLPLLILFASLFIVNDAFRRT